MKTCTKCKVEKQKTEFSKNKGKKDGLRSNCKSCDRAYRSENLESISAYQRAYHAENAESIRARKREYNASNPEKKSEQDRKHYYKNAESINARHRAYDAAHPEKRAEINRNRRAIVRSAEGSHTYSDIRDIFESQRGKCASCTKKLFKSGENKFHIDHIQPLSKGGSNWPSNLQCLCPGCNLRKHAKDPYEWAKENGRLL